MKDDAETTCLPLLPSSDIESALTHLETFWPLSD